MRIHGLIIGAVAGFGAAVEIRRNGNLAHRFEHRRKGDIVSVPSECNEECIATAFTTRGAERNLLAIDSDNLLEVAAFPALGVAHKAQPSAGVGGLENLGIVDGRNRFEAEHLDGGTAAGFAKTQAGINHLSVVVDEHAVLGQQSRHVAELMRGDVATGIKQQFAAVAVGQRMLGNAFVGQRIVEILNAYVANVVDIHCFVEKLGFCIGNVPNGCKGVSNEPSRGGFIPQISRQPPP